MSNTVYNRNKANSFKAAGDLLTPAVMVILLKTTYTVNADHNFAADLTIATNEVTGTGSLSGYANRKTLASKAVTQDDTGDRGLFAAANLTYAAINAGIVGALALAVKNTADADSELVAFFDSGFPVTTNSGDLNINWDATNKILSQT